MSRASASECEGVLKFQLEHRDGPAPEHPDLPVLMRLRDELFVLGLIGVNAVGIGYGNVSVRSEAGQAVPFVISGTGTGGRAHLDALGYCRVTACDAAGNRIWSEGPVAASSESMTHWAVYAARPDVGCVIHVHSRPLFDALLRAGACATPRDVEYGTPAMTTIPPAVSPATHSRTAWAMAGHDEGVLAFAPDLISVGDVVRAAMRLVSSDIQP